MAETRIIRKMSPRESSPNGLQEGTVISVKSSVTSKSSGARGKNLSGSAKKVSSGKQASSGTSKRFPLSRKELLNDYKLARLSRELSILGRKEVLTGKAKFGIFGDGKELPQIVLSKFFQNGDFRSGYYRDQTLMMAIGQLTPEQFFAQLYANPDNGADPHSGGRQMNAHFATRLLDEDGNWLPQTSMKISSADMSPTASQMPRLVGLGYASKLYRHLPELSAFTQFSNQGNEIVFGTIGDASTSEGVFWESVNAAGVLQIPVVISVWDDGYGISVEKKYQTTKESISEILSGFQRTDKLAGYEILKVKAWDYPSLYLTYQKATEFARKEHIPVLIHVEEVSQPLGHSTSGSHERYKSVERLKWEEDFCCCNQMRLWLLSENLASEKELDTVEESVKKIAKEAQKRAWTEFQDPIKQERQQVAQRLQEIIQSASLSEEQTNSLQSLVQHLLRQQSLLRRHVISTVRQALLIVTDLANDPVLNPLKEWLRAENEKNHLRFNAHLLSNGKHSPLQAKRIDPVYGDRPPLADGRVILRDHFDALFSAHPNLVIFGEDSGKLGDVNLGLEGLQEKYGALRITDTGIREATILGQGIGMALRGLRPIAEIQYLDYLLYCFQTLSDDVATLRYRTNGGQTAPVIVRTRGHRLEGIWHSGSPMGMILNGIRGVHVCVPRNLTDAAGFYTTLLQGDDPALVIEPLNAYRLKEKRPLNIGKFSTPLGIPELVEEGSDITLVSYGSTFNVVQKSLSRLRSLGISAELIDVKTLLPFDIEHRIRQSLQKTNRILFIDEDVPGGATAFMMQQVLQVQKGFELLDSPARCLSASDHRPAYSSDGDYFSKPSIEDVVETVYDMMSESNPTKFPSRY